jgi:glycerate dehydrogenase
VVNVDLPTLLARADVVTLHCPLNAATRGLINAERIALMKPGALLINTGRGPLVNEADLAAALHSGRLGGAGLDVLSAEPPSLANPLISAPNCVITPHIAWASQAARRRLIAASAANAAAILAGAPLNVVNGV